MHKMFHQIIVLTLVLFIASCSDNMNYPKEIHILPTPVKVEKGKGFFKLPKTISVFYPKNWEAAYELCNTFLSPHVKMKSYDDNLNKKIVFSENLGLKNEEYVLEVKKNKIVIESKTVEGAIYATQSLRQLLPNCIEDKNCDRNSIQIPQLRIVDKPQFSYRGMHLDVGRHYFDTKDIKRYLDLMAMFKMNTFHWHLTEDQGWRLEIKKFPKLTSHAAFRKETLIGHYNEQPHQFDGKEYGGFYTQNEVKDIVQYAQKLGITVIPEIEMPGHSQAAISAYPELGCTDKPVDVATKWGVFNEIYCSQESTFAFLESVLDEVIQLFPSPYIHIGGDEAPKTNWESCANCQKRIADENLKDTHELQSYFIKRIEKYLNAKGKKIIGWDEILEGGLAPNATVMSWRGTQGAIEAVKKGNSVILTPGSHCYFDHYQSMGDEPLAIGGYLPLEKVFQFNPIPEELSEDQYPLVLGAQGNVWTEYMKNFKQVEYMAYPRTIALSEKLWAGQKSKSYPNFLQKLDYLLKRFDVLNVNYANHFNQIQGAVVKEKDKLYYELKTLLPQKNIVYSLNSKDKFTKYNKPIPLELGKKSVIRAQVIKTNKSKSSLFTQVFRGHKATQAQVKINPKPHENYNTGGESALINGVNGLDNRYGDKEWLGFWGENVEILIQFKETLALDSIKTRLYHAPGQWIYAPQKIEIYSSVDGEKFKFLKTIPIRAKENGLIQVESFLTINTKFLKLKIPNYGVIPSGKQGAGNKAWTFIDEIELW